MRPSIKPIAGVMVAAITSVLAPHEPSRAHSLVAGKRTGVLTASMKRVLRRACVAAAVVVTAAWTCPATAVDEPTHSPQIVELSVTPSADDIATAKERLRQGDLVRLTGKALGSVSQIGGIVLSNTRGASTSGPVPGRTSSARSTPLIRHTIGLRKSRSGVVHQLEIFTSAESKHPQTRPREAFARWVKDQRALSAKAGDAAPSQAWTPLFNITLIAESEVTPNETQSTVNVYRLVETNDANDWYMVLTDASLLPDYQGCVFGFAPNLFCGWYNQSRSIQISLSGGTLIDHGPTGTVTSSTVGFSIGGSLSPAGPGFSGNYSQTWTQPAVTTTDTSNATIAAWNEAFTGPELPFFDPPPPITSTSGFLSHQGAIFSTPEGTTSISIPVQISTTWAFVGELDGLDHTFLDTLELSTTINTGPPFFAVVPSSLSIAPGGTATVRVTALIPNSPDGFSWTIATNHPATWLSVPSPGPFSESRDIPVTVAAGTANGLTGTLTIDSMPAFAAPSVEGGPLLVNITVGTPSPPLLPPAGVLLAGGEVSGLAITNQANVYDVATQQIVPVANMTTPRLGHTATLLANGDILIAGGCTDQAPNFSCIATATAEIYHPAASAFTAVGSMTTARHMPLSTLLQDGRVLIVGGENGFGSRLDSAEIYDPATRTFTATGPPMHGHLYGGITAINPPGKGSQAIVYGGRFASEASDAASWELWDSTAGTNGSFASAGSMPTGQAQFPTAVPLADGRFVIIGGTDTHAEPLSTEQLLMPGTQTFSLGLPLNQARDTHTLTALTTPPGLLVTGGINSSGAALATAEVRGPSGWTVLSGTGPCPGSAGCMTAARSSHTATLLPDGRVVIAGGWGGNGALGATEFYDPASQTFQVGPLMRPAAGHTATAFSLTDVPSTLTLISDVNPSAFGEQVTFTATVSPSAASGQVTFSEGSNTLKSAPLSNGQATFQTSALTPGPHTITATYGGDKTFLGSSGSVVQSVSQLLSGTTLSGPTSAAAGQKVTYTASVSPNNAAGQVAFYDQGAQLAIVNLAPNNQAVYSSTSFTLGLHSITAKYLGNADYQPSSSGAVQLNVSQATSTTKLASTPNPSTYQQPITLTATVTSTFGTPVGQVSFLDGSTTIGSAALSGGSATLTVANLSGGSHVLTAAYQGSANVAASTSPSITQTVKPAATSTAVASSLNPSTFGQSVTFTATVLPTSGSGTPTGTVAFKDGNATLGTVPLNSGAATFSTAALSGGSHTITAAYAGDGNYAGSTSAAIPQTVNRAVANVAVFSTLNPSFYGQSVTLTAQVSASAGAPTGTVTFKDGTATLGTASLSSGQASINTPALTGGIHTITAVYGGDTNFLISTSSPLTQVVNKSGTSTAVISSLNPSNTGQPVIFTATVTPQSGINPTGIVTFTDGTTILGTPSLSGGVAALTTSSLAAGTHVIVATYGGDRNYTGSSSQGLAQNVISTMMTPVFSNLTPSQTVPLGTAHIDLSGTISAPGPAYPPANENVSVTIGGISRQVNIGGKGAFSFNNFPTNTLAGGMYNITYSYAGDAAFNAAMNSTTTLTVGGGSSLPTTTTLTPSVQACITGQDFILTISVAVVPPASPPDGQVVLTRKNPDGTITSLGQQYLVGGVWAPAFNGMATGRYTFFGHYQGTAQFQASDGQADLTCNEP